LSGGVWRAGGTGEYVVDLGPSQERVAGLDDEIGEEPHDFCLVSAEGEVTQTFRLSWWSVEEELGASVYAVADGALKKRVVQVWYGPSMETARKETVVVDVLEPVGEEDFAARRTVELAMQRRSDLAEAQRAERKRKGDAEIAAIPGAEEVYGVSEAFDRAQSLLAGRVRDFSDRTATEVLRVLVGFGVVYRGMGDADRASLAAVADALATAGRLVAFDRFTEPVIARLEPVPTCPAREWLNAVASAEGALEKEAAYAEWIDARLNAMRYRRASVWLAQARSYFDVSDGSGRTKGIS